MIVRSLFYVYALRGHLKLGISELQQTQLQKLKATIKYAYENVPFYKRKFDDAGVKVENIRSAADLAKFPITTKSEIQRNSSQDLKAKGIEFSECLRKTTSGSTGIPLEIFVDRRALDFENALWTRALMENGLRLRDKMTVLGDPRSFPKRKKWFESFGVARRDYLSIFDDVADQMEALKNYQPDAIRSYPTALSAIASSSKGEEISVKPRSIFTFSELLDKTSRNVISSAFGSELFDNYASSEFGLMAWECREHNGYHVNIDSIVMEFCSHEEPVALGERGEIVCTSLSNRAMPLIRYKMDDVGIPVEDRCSCGRTLPLMRIIEGRKDDFLTTTDGKAIPPTIFFPFPFANFDAIKQFRVIQERKDQLVVQIVPKMHSFNDPILLQNAQANIHEIFGKDMNVEFQIAEQLDRDPSGKLRKIISHVSPSI